MSAQIWTYLLVGVTFFIYIIIAIVARAGSTKEFYVAGGGVHPIVNGMATAADWMSAASFFVNGRTNSFHGFLWRAISYGLDRWICSSGLITCTIS